jgi:hypothetical protein
VTAVAAAHPIFIGCATANPSLFFPAPRDLHESSHVVVSQFPFHG